MTAHAPAHGPRSLGTESGRLGRFFIGAILAAEVAASLVTDLDAVRAAACSLVIALGMSWLFARWAMHPSFTLPGELRATVPPLLVLTYVGSYGLVLAIVNKTNVYYLAADIYHWFIETLLLAMLTIGVLCRAQPHQIARMLGLLGLSLGALALAMSLAGTLGMPLPGGGHLASSVGMWRLEAGRAFPVIPLALVTAALFRGGFRGGLKLVLILAFAILLIDLVFSLKRSVWLTYAAAVFLIALPRIWLLIGTSAVLAAGCLGGGLLTTVHNGLGMVVQSVSSDLSYNPSYTVEDTMEDRWLQWVGTVPHILNVPQGHGLGAEIYTWIPHDNVYAMVHYIHNAYLYYLVQLGFPGMIATGLTLLWLLLRLWAVMDARAPWEWLARGAFAGLVIALVTGLTIVSWHSVFFGFCIGLGLIVVVRSRRPAHAAAPAPFRRPREVSP